ncbi:MAG: flagellar biosynthesis protein FlhF [Acidobacteriota bacterium]
MKIKTYRSDSVPKALEQIRKDLGDGAVILSTRRTKKRKLLGLVPSLAYEITAAAEPDASNGGASHSLPSETYEISERPPVTASQDPSLALSPPDGRAALEKREKEGEDSMQPRLEQLSAEIQELKRMVSRRQSAASVPWALEFSKERGNGFGKSSRLDWKTAQASARLLSRLVSEGMDEGLAHSLVHYASQQIEPAEPDLEGVLQSRLQAALERMLETAPIPAPEKGAARAAIFIGPTGVGKTTTIAKLAAVFALGEGRRVQLLTLDTYRIAAAEQLKTYADIIGVPIQVLHKVEELDQAIRKSGDRDTILIDTSGHSHKSVDSSSRSLADFLKDREDVEKHLVLSLTTKADDSRGIIEGFSAFTPDKLVFTKMDETSSLGALSEGILSGLPISYLTNGQAVPDDLLVPSPQSVAELIVRGT